MSQSDTPSQDPVHIMVDIETLDTIPSAVILSIGACVICKRPGNELTSYMELEVATQHERTRSVGTEIWWKQQGSIPDRGTIPLTAALNQFSRYLANLTVRPIIWCKGTDFDVAILAHAYKQVGIPVPWKYNDVRDFRTIKKMFEESIDQQIKNENPHNALDDAIFQARQLDSIELVLK